jgi:transposase
MGRVDWRGKKDQELSTRRSRTIIIIGCDSHTRSEQIAMLDTATGEVVEKKLEHEDGEAKRFYEGLKEPARVGIETTGYTLWFAQMLGELGHELVVGDAAKIRAMEPPQQKHDRRDAERLLNLLMRGDFPKMRLEFG